MPPDIYTYLNYRDYLRDMFARYKTAIPKITQREFARRAGLKSSYYISWVVRGDRNITAATALKFAEVLGLDANASLYFEMLVRFTQARDDHDKDVYFDRLLHLRPKKYLRELAPDQSEYFSRRYYVTIREMVALRDFREDPAWIAAHVKPPLRPKQVSTAIKVLIRLGLLVRDGNGVLKHSRKSLSTSPVTDDVKIYQYQRALLSEARLALLNESEELVDMVSITLPMNRARLPEIRTALQKCRGDIIAIIRQDHQAFEEVYQVNLQYYPLTNASGFKENAPCATTSAE